MRNDGESGCGWLYKDLVSPENSTKREKQQPTENQKNIKTEILVNTFHSGVRDTRTFMPMLAYRCTSILVLAIPCQQLPPGARTPACTVGCQRLPPANANSRLAEREARGCSKSQITNITFIIGIHSRSGQQK